MGVAGLAAVAQQQAGSQDTDNHAQLKMSIQMWPWSADGARGGGSEGARRSEYSAR